MRLEKENALSCKTYNIVKSVRQQVQQRIEDKFFGFIYTNTMRSFSSDDKESMKLTLIAWYKYILKYIDDHYDFSESNYLASLRIFALEKEFTYNELTE